MSITDGIPAARDCVSAANGGLTVNAMEGDRGKRRIRTSPVRIGRSIGWRRFANNRASRNATSHGIWEWKLRPFVNKNRKRPTCH